MTKTMQDALAYAKQNGGKLCRYPGGFWMREGLQGTAVERGTLQDEVWFSSQTIQGLLKRKAVSAVQFRQNASGEFPVMVAVIAGEPGGALPVRKKGK